MNLPEFISEEDVCYICNCSTHFQDKEIGPLIIFPCDNETCPGTILHEECRVRWIQNWRNEFICLNCNQSELYIFDTNNWDEFTTGSTDATIEIPVQIVISRRAITYNNICCFCLIITCAASFLMAFLISFSACYKNCE